MIEKVSRVETPQTRLPTPTELCSDGGYQNDPKVNFMLNVQSN
jgi:hypothetical protein